MGQAYGELMKDEILALHDQAFDFIYAQITEHISSLPPMWQKLIAEEGVHLALNLTYDFTKEFIPQHYFDMAKGKDEMRIRMANSTGLSWYSIMSLSLFPELIKASCSMIGAWGPATAGTDSGLVQLRALDWTTDGPFQQFPVVVVYHPSTQGHTFSTLSWAGLLGSITGYSAANIGVSEKVWLHYDGPYSPAGIPFHFLLQDILQFDMDIDAALSRIASANRTCSIFIGLGDYYNNRFVAVEYSHTTVNVYNDRNFPAYPPYHDLYKGVVFVDKHTQPSHNDCLNSLISTYYGKLDAVTMLRYITPVLQTGNNHIAIYGEWP
ncbi:dcd1A [Symbiodinium sp. KB8]|nr:dcd1A [Symbiodinium sp. KB8]